MTLPAGALDMQQVRTEAGMQGALYLNDLQCRLFVGKQDSSSSLYMSELRSRTCWYWRLTIGFYNGDGVTTQFGFRTSTSTGSVTPGPGAPPPNIMTEYDQRPNPTPTIWNYLSFTTTTQATIREWVSYTQAGTPDRNTTNVRFKVAGETNPPLDWSNFGGTNASRVMPGISNPWESLVGQTVTIQMFHTT